MIEPSGIIVLDKRPGISSAHAIAEVKRKLNLRKIGHAGTLDPAATGILVCLVNQATKSAKLFEGGIKTYEGTIQLGLTTLTNDLDDEILTQSNHLPNFAKIKSCIGSFTGEISQVPPVVSAIKVNGKRAYDLVRKQGLTPELKARNVSIYSFDIEPRSEDTIWFRVVCSSGTYIRSLARDLGCMLGCGGALATLRRVGSMPLTISEAKNLDDLTLSDIRPLESIIKTPKEPECHLL